MVHSVTNPTMCLNTLYDEYWRSYGQIRFFSFSSCTRVFLLGFDPATFGIGAEDGVPGPWRLGEEEMIFAI